MNKFVRKDAVRSLFYKMKNEGELEEEDAILEILYELQCILETESYGIDGRSKQGREISKAKKDFSSAVNKLWIASRDYFKALKGK